MAADRTLVGYVSGDEPTGEVPAPPRIGQRFEVLGLIGSGGMGSVYRVRDTELDEIVALKLLRGVTEIASVARFRQEVKLARRVTHPNVVRTFDLGEYVDGGDVIRFLTMQLVEGPSLTRLIAEAGPLKIERVVELGREIAAGVHAAHEAGVLHRDLKPDNILIADVGTKDEAALITDFGIARASAGDAAKTGVVLGTPAYMAPEQVRGAEVGPAADLYAIGVILFEMTTGKRAFPGTEPLAVATARLFGGPPDPRPLRKGMPDALADVIMRCMALDPRDRYASAADLESALQSITAVTPTVGLRPSAPAMPTVGTPIVAVLPIRSSSDADSYVATGLTDDIVDLLTGSPGLRVAPLWDASGDPREVARKAGAHALFDASIRRLPDGTLRLSARLVGVAEGFQLWSRRVDGDSSSLVAQIGQLCVEIGDALAVHVRAVGRGATTDPRAVDLYLRARHLMRVPELEPALAALDEAVALSPDDPAILSAHANALSRLSFFGGSVPGDAGAYRRRAKASATRALDLAPYMGEPWSALAAVRSVEGDYIGSARAAKTAVTHSPGLVRAQEQVASMMLECGRFDDAIARLRAALALDATNIARGELARAYALLKRWPEVDAVLATLRTDSPGSKFARLTTLARLRLWDRSRPEAVDDFGLDPLRGGPITQFTWWARKVARGEQPPVELAAFVQGAAEANGPRTTAIAGQMTAELYAAAGQHELVFPLIELAMRGAFFDLGWLDLCPVLAPLRGDPRFAAIRAQVAERVSHLLAALDGPPEG